MLFYLSSVSLRLASIRSEMNDIVNTDIFLTTLSFEACCIKVLPLDFVVVNEVMRQNFFAFKKVKNDRELTHR